MWHTGPESLITLRAGNTDLVARMTDVNIIVCLLMNRPLWEQDFGFPNKSEDTQPLNQN